MKQIVAIALLCVCVAVPAAAQTEGRVGIGASVTWMSPTDSDVGSLTGFGPLVRLNPIIWQQAEFKFQ